jgi:hypothetical protein
MISVYLQKPPSITTLHNSGKRRSMWILVSFKGIIDIWMGIKMKNIYRTPELLTDSSDNRKRYWVITT